MKVTARSSLGAISPWDQAERRHFLSVLEELLPLKAEDTPPNSGSSSRCGRGSPWAGWAEFPGGSGCRWSGEELASRCAAHLPAPGSLRSGWLKGAVPVFPARQLAGAGLLEPVQASRPPSLALVGEATDTQGAQMRTLGRESVSVARMGALPGSCCGKHPGRTPAWPPPDLRLRARPGHPPPTVFRLNCPTSRLSAHLLAPRPGTRAASISHSVRAGGQSAVSLHIPTTAARGCWSQGPGPAPACGGDVWSPSTGGCCGWDPQGPVAMVSLAPAGRGRRAGKGRQGGFVGSGPIHIGPPSSQRRHR